MWSGKTYEELTVPQPLAIWSSARDAWETPGTEGLFCEHLDVFSETFPTSGMTLSGVAYELPTWEPATDVSESSYLLPTPAAHEPGFTMEPVDKYGNKPTHGAQRWYSPETGRLLQKGVSQVIANLLPTPSACVANDGESTETWLARRERVKLTAANGNGMGMPLTIASLLIGENTNQPSDDGKLDSDGQLLGQQNLLDAMKDIA